MLNKTLQTIGLLAVTSNISVLACNGSHILGAGGSGAIHTISADTMKQGDMFIGINSENINNHTLTDTRIRQALREGTDHIHNVDSTSTYALAFSYGVTDNLTLNLNLPYSVRRNIRAGHGRGGHGGHGSHDSHGHGGHDHGHGGHIGGPYDIHSHGDASGISDMAAIALYKFYDQDDIQMAALAGVKAPTGKRDVVYDDQILETDLQPGSGSWDIFTGGALSKNFSTFSIHSSVLYKHTTKNDLHVELGDILDYGLAFSYKLKEEHQHIFGDAGDDHFDYNINAFLEFNGEYVHADTAHGMDIDNTGHHIVYATVGVQLFEESGYSAFVAFGLPVYQDLVGVQNEVSNRFSLGIGKSF